MKRWKAIQLEWARYGSYERIHEHYFTINVSDTIREPRKLSIVNLEAYNCLMHGIDSDDWMGITWDYTMDELASTLQLGGIGQVVVFYHIMFIKISEDTWSVHYKYEDGKIKRFENISFTLFIEYGLFEQLIEVMLEGPEVYWGVKEYIEPTGNFADNLIKKHLNRSENDYDDLPI